MTHSKEALNAEFSISITKKKGDPNIDVDLAGNANQVICAMVEVMGDITARDTNPGKSTENVIAAYRDAVSRYTEAAQ